MLKLLAKLEAKATEETEDAIADFRTNLELFRIRKAKLDMTYDIDLAREGLAETGLTLVEMGLVSRTTMIGILATEFARPVDMDEAIRLLNDLENRMNAWKEAYSGSDRDDVEI